MAHSVRTGALTRSLISSARTPVERAFAWAGVGRRAGQALASMRILGALTGISLAFLNPVAPSPWLLDGIEMAAAAHTDLFLEAYRFGGREVTDCGWSLAALSVVVVSLII